MKQLNFIRGPLCRDDDHNFVLSHTGFVCINCGLKLPWDAQHISKYMGSYFGNVTYQWTPGMDEKKIVSISVSAGDRPVFEASCDFTNLYIRNCLKGSRDGWMQPHYPEDYFKSREIKLNSRDIQELRRFLESCDWSEWKTPIHYVENHDAPGFSVSRRFQCTFSDGKQFACLAPETPEFDSLLSRIRNAAKANAAPEDKAFVQRMLLDTETQYKQIYWLISQSLRDDHRELIAKGAPFFNYMISRELKHGDKANAELLVNMIRFSSGANWVTKSAVPESEYQWAPLPVETGNDLGAAFTLLTRHFETLPEPSRRLFPIVAVVLDDPITDDWLAAQARFQSLPGVKKNVLTIALVMGDGVEKRFLKKFDGVIYHINSIEDIINEMDSPLFGL